MPDKQGIFDRRIQTNERKSQTSHKYMLRKVAQKTTRINNEYIFCGIPMSKKIVYLTFRDLG